MEQITITAKIQISATADDKVLLNKTMSVYSDACNYVSDYVFRTHDLKQFSLNKALYSTLRERFGLKSQMAQSVFKTVIAKYKTVLENESKWIKPSLQLGGMFGVVAAYADDFHALSLFIVVVALCPDHHPDHVNRQVDSEDYGKSLLLAGQFEYCCK